MLLLSIKLHSPNLVEEIHTQCLFWLLSGQRIIKTTQSWAAVQEFRDRAAMKDSNSGLPLLFALLHVFSVTPRVVTLLQTSSPRKSQMTSGWREPHLRVPPTRCQFVRHLLFPCWLFGSDRTVDSVFAGFLQSIRKGAGKTFDSGGVW
jgi:hypothetical protein